MLLFDCTSTSRGEVRLMILQWCLVGQVELFGLVGLLKASLACLGEQVLMV